jgi:putative SOS response-associated peptidase YedK
MCGRAYETYTADELYFRYLNLSPPFLLPITPVYNLAPTQNSPIVRVLDGEKRIDPMRWQLAPYWAPEFSTKLSTINAKSETIFESGLYKKLIVRRRCIVPISGFYEWKKDGAKKRPFKIFMPDEPIMSLAGVWDVWHRGSADEGHSFSIITTAGNTVMCDLHDRMPVILGRDMEADWLNPEIHEPEQIKAMLRSCPKEWLKTVEVSTLVNSPKNNIAEVLEALVTVLACAEGESDGGVHQADASCANREAAT